MKWRWWMVGIRWIATALLLSQAYQETGSWTVLYLAILFVALEAQSFYGGIQEMRIRDLKFNTFVDEGVKELWRTILGKGK